MHKLNLRRLVTTAHGLETLKREKVIQNCIGQFHMQKEKKRKEERPEPISQRKLITL